MQARGESVRDAAGRATRFVMSIVDITERREAELRLAASERRYRALVEASPSLIWTCDAAGRLTFVSARASRELYGYEPREMIGRHVVEFNAPEFGRREFMRRFAPVLRGRAVFDAEAIHRSRTGERVYVVVSALPVRDESGRIEAVFGICSDITALKLRERELNAALRNQQVIFEAAGEGIAFVRDDRIESANGALAKMLGVTRDRLVGRAVAEFLAHPEQWQTVRRACLEAAARGEAAIHEAMLRPPTATGHSAWCQVTARQIGDDPGATILVLTDVTLLKRREELAWHQANHDELTGLPNRRLLVEHARRLLSVALRQRRQAALLVLDLDGFKEVNDVFGHAHGDALLRRVALRLASVLREYDVVARTGGDEFVVLLPEIDEAAVAVRVAEKLVGAAREDLEAAGQPAHPCQRRGGAVPGRWHRLRSAVCARRRSDVRGQGVRQELLPLRVGSRRRTGRRGVGRVGGRRPYHRTAPTALATAGRSGRFRRSRVCVGSARSARRKTIGRGAPTRPRRGPGCGPCAIRHPAIAAPRADR